MIEPDYLIYCPSCFSDLIAAIRSSDESDRYIISDKAIIELEGSDLMIIELGSSDDCSGH
jgi:hypothetical protein